MQRHMSQEVLGTMCTDRLREAATVRRRAHGSADSLAQIHRQAISALTGHL
jgi:hypothetical protein